MAEAVLKKIDPKKDFIIGRQVLDILTSGMYDNPLMIYREYVQNAADSIDLAYDKKVFAREDGIIKVHINGLNRTISIFDNGLGVSNQNVERVLLSVGYSSKEGTQNRGFRGIGRLGGLAYCKKLRFETRSKASEQVAIVDWDQHELSNLLEDGKIKTLEEAIGSLSSVRFRPATNEEPSHFFKVTLEGVERFHTDQLMDIHAVRKYLSQVAPVPYDKDNFSFSKELEEYFSDVKGVTTYNLSLNGEQVFRPYVDEFDVAKDRKERIRSIEFFKFTDTSGTLIAKGWFAKTNFMSAFPQSFCGRGVRIRQGNIEVGNEYSLADFYAERRFASWQIGEIQICGNKLKTNARRDGFEHTPNYQVFLERAGLLGGHLSKLCREASKERCAKQRVEIALSDLKSLTDEDATFINEKHFESALNLANSKLEQIKQFVENNPGNDEIEAEYHALADKITSLDHDGQLLSEKVNGQILNRKKGKKVIEDLIASIKQGYGKAQSADELISHVLGKYLKSSIDKNINIIGAGLEE